MRPWPLIFSRKYRGKQSNTSKEKKTQGVITNKTPDHTRLKTSPRRASPRSRNSWNDVVCICCSLCASSAVLREHVFLCVRTVKEEEKRECACPLVHVRHCFKQSSYWNGKEWRRAGAEEQATGGGTRERGGAEGPLASGNPLVISVDRWDTEEGGLICLKAWEQPSADSSAPPFCCLLT